MHAITRAVLDKFRIQHTLTLIKPLAFSSSTMNVLINTMQCSKFDLLTRAMRISILDNKTELLRRAETLIVKIWM